MTDRLKPCPFCGGTPIIEEYITGWYAVCDCGIETTNTYYSKEELIKAWNTRKPMDRIVEQLKEVSFIDWDEKYIDNGECLIYLADAIEIVKEGGKDVTTRNDTGMD